MVAWLIKAAGLAVVPMLLAISLISSTQEPINMFQSITNLQQHLLPNTVPEPYTCAAPNYTTQIISLDPLLLYLHDFLSPADTAALLASASDKFSPSLTTKHGRTRPDPDRTSHSAFLSNETLAVQCVLARARLLSGALLPGHAEEMVRPQLVRYTADQHFGLHYDWFPHAQTAPDGRRWNRIASFFAVLEDECEGGETWFPNLTAAVTDNGLWRRHPEGGLAFRPVKGNALFWINLRPDGKGDERVKHAGLALESGRKTAMNIWPRRYFDG